MSVTALILFMICADSIIGQAHLLDLGFNEWDIFIETLLTQQFIMVSVIFLLVPYKYLIAKTLAFIFMLSEGWESVQYLSDNDMYPALLVASLIVFPLWLFYALFRTYELKAVTPENGILYRVTHKPDNFSGFVLSWCNDPAGGSGIWMDGKLYHFHNGKFSIYDRLPKGAICLPTKIKSNPRIKAYLESKEGEAWSLTNNCLWSWRRIKNADRCAAN